jgi:hypothetical protein
MIGMVGLTSFASAASKSIWSDEGAAYYAAVKYSEIFSNCFELGSKMASVFSTTGGDTMVSRVTEAIESIADKIGKSMEGVGIALAFLFFLIALLGLAQTERLTMEFFIKFFAKLVVSLAVILLLFDGNDFGSKGILTICREFGTALSEQVADGLDSEGQAIYDTETLYTSFLQQIKDGDVNKWSLIFNSMLTAVPIGLVSWALLIITYMVVFSRLLELTVRGTFMPIAVAMIADDGWRGSGGRYIRKYLALCAQGAVLVMIGQLTTMVMAVASRDMATDAGNLGGYIIIVVGISVACVQLMFKSIGIINDVFGA